MTIAQKSKETRVETKDGNGINLCSVYPANNPYTCIYDLHHKKVPVALPYNVRRTLKRCNKTVCERCMNAKQAFALNGQIKHM